MAATPQTGGPDRAGSQQPVTREKLRALISSPILGFAPWIAMSVITGPGRFEIAVGVALGLSVVTAVAGRLLGMSVKMLDAAGIVYFAVLAVIGAVIDENGLEWLETWAGELSNIMLVVIALGSMAVRVPFTVQYAREQAPREYWYAPAFMRINYVITGAWALAFIVSAVAGLIGNVVLDNPNNIWTGWIIQIGAIILAAKFTAWYPDYARARVLGDREAPHPGALLLPLAGYLIPVGIVLLSVNAGPWWIGVGLIVIGVAVTNALRQQTRPGEQQASGGI